MRASQRQPSVCIVRHSFYPSELNVKREAETLVKAGMDVSVICLRDEGEKSRETINGVHVYRMPVGHKRGKILRYLFEYKAFFLLASLKLFALNLKRRFKVIQVNTMPDILVFVTLIPKLMGTKVVLHMHEPMPELFTTMFSKNHHKWLVPLIKMAEKSSLKFADRVLTVTREMRDKFGERGANINKITVIVNVPDDEIFKADRFKDLREEVAALKKEERRRGVFRILSHGAIEERYGFDIIVKAVANLKSKIPGIRFRFMGRGSYLDTVLGLSRDLMVEDRVDYLGFVSFDEMVKEILLADVCIVPVARNPYSVLVHTNKMYEYIALNRPVIASRLDSVLSYFPEDTLIFFKPGDAEDLAEKVYYVFSHPDEVSRKMLEVKKIYDTFCWEREKKKYLGVYRALLSEGTVLG